MRWTRAFIHTRRHDPADAEVVSHRLMVRAAMISKVAAGISTYLPLGWRSIRKLEAIVREEMDRAGATELSMPAVQPAELWRESGRWTQYGPELLRITDRHQRDLCFGPTHEEVITDTVRRAVRSYRQLPVNLYQIQTKFRDEIRPRFGLMRGREFIMKDAYSFDVDADGLETAYRGMERAYRRILERCGLRFTQVEADTSNIGGSESHELMVVADTGEDAILSCASCGYGANVEKAAHGDLASPPDWPDPIPGNPSEVATPDQRSVEQVSSFLGIQPANLIKTLLFSTESGTVAALTRGDRDVNQVKLRNAIGCRALQLASAETIAAVTGGPQGFSGPVGLTGVRMVADPSVMAMPVAATGANSADTHLVGVVPGRDLEPDAIVDVNTARAGDPCPCCNGALDEARGIEVGHIFKLGAKYSVAMQCTFLDAEGAERPCIMGCYGLGIGRTVAAAVEQNHDDNGIIWPLPLAPYEVVLAVLNTDKPDVVAAADAVYERLLAAGVDVLFDDRPERPGVKLNDMDLIGFPIRVVVGQRSLANDEVELSLRRDRERRQVPLEALEEELATARNACVAARAE
jgi:prolyl-tRNA synthetase